MIYAVFTVSLLIMTGRATFDAAVKHSHRQKFADSVVNFSIYWWTSVFFLEKKEEKKWRLMLNKQNAVI